MRLVQRGDIDKPEVPRLIRKFGYRPLATEGDKNFFYRKIMLGGKVLRYQIREAAKRSVGHEVKPPYRIVVSDDFTWKESTLNTNKVNPPPDYVINELIRRVKDGSI